MPTTPDDDPRLTPAEKEARDVTVKSALAMELPFTIVGAVVVGGLIGYGLDKWLHTDPWLMVVFGALGFAGGLLEVIRRLAPGKNS